MSYAEEDDTANDCQYRRPPSLHTFTYIFTYIFLADATHALCIVEVKQTSKVAGADSCAGLCACLIYAGFMPDTHTHTDIHTRPQLTAHNLQRLGEEHAADDRGDQDAASSLYCRHIHWRDNRHCLILRQLIKRIGSTSEDN